MKIGSQHKSKSIYDRRKIGWIWFNKLLIYIYIYILIFSFMTRNSLLQRRTTSPDFGATTSPWCSPSTAFHVSKSWSTCKWGKWGRDSHPHICGNIKGFITVVSTIWNISTMYTIGCVWVDLCSHNFWNLITQKITIPPQALSKKVFPQNSFCEVKGCQTSHICHRNGGSEGPLLANLRSQNHLQNLHWPNLRRRHLRPPWLVDGPSEGDGDGDVFWSRAGNQAGSIYVQ